MNSFCADILWDTTRDSNASLTHSFLFVCKDCLLLWQITMPIVAPPQNQHQLIVCRLSTLSFLQIKRKPQLNTQIHPIISVKCCGSFTIFEKPVQKPKISSIHHWFALHPKKYARTVFTWITTMFMVDHFCLSVAKPPTAASSQNPPANRANNTELIMFRFCWINIIYIFSSILLRFIPRFDLWKQVLFVLWKIEKRKKQKTERITTTTIATAYITCMFSISVACELWTLFVCGMRFIYLFWWMLAWDFRRRFVGSTRRILCVPNRPMPTSSMCLHAHTALVWLAKGDGRAHSDGVINLTAVDYPLIGTGQSENVKMISF